MRATPHPTEPDDSVRSPRRGPVERQYRISHPTLTNARRRDAGHRVPAPRVGPDRPAGDAVRRQLRRQGGARHHRAAVARGVGPVVVAGRPRRQPVLPGLHHRRLRCRPDQSLDVAALGAGGPGTMLGARDAAGRGVGDVRGAGDQPHVTRPGRGPEFGAWCTPPHTRGIRSPSVACRARCWPVPHRSRRSRSRPSSRS